MKVVNFTITKNTAKYGGGIYGGEDTILEYCTITDNTANWCGGGVHNGGEYLHARILYILRKHQTKTKNQHDDINTKIIKPKNNIRTTPNPYINLTISGRVITPTPKTPFPF